MSGNIIISHYHLSPSACLSISLLTPSSPLSTNPLPSPSSPPPPRSSHHPHASSPTAAPSSTLETRSRPHPHSVSRPVRAKKEGNIPVVLSWLDKLPHKHMQARKALQTTDQHGQIHRPARPERYFKPKTSMPRPTDQQGLFLLTPSTGRPVRRSDVALAQRFIAWLQIWAPRRRKLAIVDGFNASSLERQSMFGCTIPDSMRTTKQGTWYVKKEGQYTC